MQCQIGYGVNWLRTSDRFRENAMPKWLRRDWLEEVTDSSRECNGYGENWLDFHE